MVGAIVLYVLIGTLDRPRALASRGWESGWNRRGFLIAATAAGIAATGAGALGRTLGSRRGQSAVASRAAVRLPRPASPAAPVPPGARLRVPGIRRQWSFPRKATPGGHTLTVRATDRTGTVQTGKRTHTVADGASGRHSVVVTVD
ncbi:hypothetical protein GCM10010353_32350 [Streptomyces chryseus]|nr:hypothetical protein GCM10010353_32350 [Streptomyces chryseus]